MGPPAYAFFLRCSPAGRRTACPFMILLLSSSGDANLDHVIDWLKLRRHPYLRINVNDLLEDDFHLSLTPPRLVVRGQEVDLESIGVVWTRKIAGFRLSRFYKQAKPRLRQE